MRTLVDLHIHTTYSDGTCSIEDIVTRAIIKGISTIAFTDHNLIIDKNELRKYMSKINIIQGVELTAYDGYERHILGYFSQNSQVEKMDSFLAGKKYDMQRVINRSILKLIKNGCTIDINRAFENGRWSIGKLMKELIRNGYASSLDEAYIMVFDRNSKDYKSLWQAKVEECISAIKECHGVAILAHPALYEVPVSEHEIKNLLVCGLDGIECYHPAHEIEDINRYLRICKEANLYISGGSDFHGDREHKGKIGEGQITEDMCSRLLNYCTN